MSITANKLENLPEVEFVQNHMMFDVSNVLQGHGDRII